MGGYSFPVRGMGGFASNSRTGSRDGDVHQRYARGGKVAATHSEKGVTSNKGTTPPGRSARGSDKAEGSVKQQFKAGGSTRYYFKAGGYIEKPVKATRAEKGVREHEGVESGPSGGKRLQRPSALDTLREPDTNNGLPGAKVTFKRGARVHKAEGGRVEPSEGALKGSSTELPFKRGGYLTPKGVGKSGRDRFADSDGEEEAGDEQAHERYNAKESNASDEQDRYPEMKRGGKTKIGPIAKGKLHRNLGIAQGKKIGMKRLKKATHSKSADIRKEAQFVVNMHKERGGKVYMPSGAENDASALSSGFPGGNDESVRYGRAYKSTKDQVVPKGLKRGGQLSERQESARGVERHAGSEFPTPPSQAARNSSAAHQRFTAAPRKQRTSADQDAEMRTEYSDFARGGMSKRANAFLHARGRGAPGGGGMGMPPMPIGGGAPMGGPMGGLPQAASQIPGPPAAGGLRRGGRTR